MKILALVAALATAGFGQGWPSVRWEPFVTGLQSPVDIQHSGDGSGRLYIVEQRGRIRLIKDGALAAAPVLDIVERVQFRGEMGLLGLAFPPRFDEKRYFYVNYVDRQRRTIVSRFRMLAGTVEEADPASEQILLTIPQPYENHNGGQIVFGPRDGYLYIGMGDGGSANDPQKFSQNPNSLLGKMLRIDTESGSTPYAIPTNNPLQLPGRPPEIWAVGVRNPWRFSFDRETGDMYIGDVGQGAKEEISFQPAASRGGENYGWSLMEGNNCFDDRNCATRTDLVRPIFDYPRSEGQSVTGGYVYRGSRFPFLRGIYIFGDYQNGNLFGLRRNGANWENAKFTATGALISCFGEDQSGEFYMANYRNGSILRLAAEPPRFGVNTVVSAASFENALAPGAIATAFVNPVPGVTGIVAAGSYPLATTLGGVTLRVNGNAVPLFAVTPGQINFQIPWTVTGDITISAAAGAETAPEFRARVNALAPALFTSDGRIAAALRGSDGSIVTASNAVARGDVVVLYATGLGAVSNAQTAGAAASLTTLSTVNARTEVLIGGRPATVHFSGLAPGYAGLYQINATVPAELAAGETELLLRVGGVTSQAVRLPLR